MLVRKFLSQNERNKRIKLDELIMCPNCQSSDFDNNGTTSITCKECNGSYEIIENEIIKFN